MGIYLEPFDPKREFVTQAAFRANGKIWGRGYRFDKSSVDLRTLRLLYEGRRIIYDDSPRAVKLLSITEGGRVKATKAGGKLASPSPVILTEDEKVARLMQRHGKVDLLAMASDIPGVKRSMSKEELARTLVRSGHGDV